MLAVALALALVPALPGFAAAAGAYQQVLLVYEREGSIPPCQFTAASYRVRSPASTPTGPVLRRLHPSGADGLERPAHRRLRRGGRGPVGVAPESTGMKIGSR